MRNLIMTVLICVFVVPMVDYSQVVNDECGIVHTEELSLSQFSVSTNNHLIQTVNPQVNSFLSQSRFLVNRKYSGWMLAYSIFL